MLGKQKAAKKKKKKSTTESKSKRGHGYSEGESKTQSLLCLAGKYLSLFIYVWDSISHEHNNQWPEMDCDAKSFKRKF